MEKIDWSKAPEGASYAAIGDDGNIIAWLVDVASPIVGTNVIARPETAWNGTGLPPVGVVCEWEQVANKGNWQKAEIKYIGSAYVIVADFAGIEQHYYLRSMQFRQIRTPEQIAADEREAAIESMVNSCSYRKSESTRIDCEALYDAGYRKQEQSE